MTERSLMPLTLQGITEFSLAHGALDASETIAVWALHKNKFTQCVAALGGFGFVTRNLEVQMKF